MRTLIVIVQKPLNFFYRISLVRRVFYTVFFLFLWVATAFSNNPQDSAKTVILEIDRAFTSGAITQKEYLDSVYNTMFSLLSANIFFSNKETIELLSQYRKTIWDNNAYDRKLAYYGLLSNQAQMANRMGEMLYYTEKIDKLERAAHNNRPSISALTNIAGYYDLISSPGKVVPLYEKNKDYVNSIPELAKKEGMSEKELAQTVIFLHFIADAFYDLKQIDKGEGIEKLIDEVATIAKQKFGNNYRIISSIDQSQIMSAIKGFSIKKDAPKQWKAIEQLEALLKSPTTPAFRKSFINTSLNFWKLEYFSQQKMHDSTARYLEIYRNIVQEAKKPYYRFLYKDYKAAELYSLGRYKESADTLNEAISILDSARSHVIQDADDLLYAKAEAEEKQILLDEADLKQKNTERKLLISGVIVAVLLLSGIFIIRFIRQKQQAKFIRFKLNLARNIHDEANPALLYAKALIRSEGSNNNTVKAELEQHIDYTMALIRSLSHDLRSDKQYSIASLLEHTEQLVHTLSADNSFSHTLTRPQDSKRFISHFQYTELKAILNECITNTIKHAKFNHLTIRFINKNDKLTLMYQDNGQGWATGSEGDGIGLKNIEERCKNLNGEFTLQNQYPNGYTIQVSIPLR